VRKLAAFLILACSLLVLAAAPALAKDPFEPLVTTEDAATGSTTGSTTTGSTDDPAVIGVPDTPADESMPNTGSDVSSWLVLSYALVVVGGAAVVVSRTLRPARL
jgi:hypothetical protein